MVNIDARLQKDSIPLIDLSLCRVLLKKDAENPWLVLVPLRENKIELIDLEISDQNTLMEEIRLCSHAIQKVFAPDKLNIATLGNIVPQLHIHVIARYKKDRAWPNPLWGTNSKDVWENSKVKSKVKTLKGELK
jgi:diadenosine tetraphosphate (Ap4A) HIT family hydrolase